MVTAAFDLESGAMPSLRKANLAVLALLAIHTLDHAVNQEPRVLPGSSSLVGVLEFAIAFASTWAAFQRSHIAPGLSTAVGALTTAGVFAVHLMPSWWNWISDPYWDFDPGAVSWLSLLALLGAAVHLTFAGFKRFRYARLIAPVGA